MYATRRTVLSYLAALGPAASLRSFGALLDEKRGDAAGRAGHASSVELYVAHGGDDKNPGTKEKPLATLARAQELVRGIDRNKETGITVWVRQGTHYLHKPLVFESEDSGTAECPVRFAACKGEQVTLSGGRRL